MILQLDFHGGTPIYLQIAEQIRRLVITGALREGDPIEPVRALAGDLKVNPMTVSKAYSQLEQEGILERRRGIGMFVAAMKPTEQRRRRLNLIEEAMEQAAGQALQAGLDLAEAQSALARQFNKVQEKRKKQS
jgi:GntR family transcriptional regulator